MLNCLNSNKVCAGAACFNLQADGSVRIPEVLQPYMGGNKEITPKNK